MSEIIRTTVEENDSNIIKHQVMNDTTDGIIRHQVRGLDQPAPEPPVLETLNVTENGTYTPDEGVDGFDVVNVDVEFPGDDAYDLKSATPGAIVSITDGEPLPLNELKISVEPVQAGSGNPSPTNVRPISGWSACEVTVKDDLTETETYNIEFKDGDNPLTVYGATVDAINGTLTVNKGFTLLDGSQPMGNYAFSTDGFVTYSATALQIPYIKQSGDIVSNRYPATAVLGNRIQCYTNNRFLINDNRFGSTIKNQTEWNDWLSNNNVQIAYELATPITYQLDPTSIRLLQGINNIFADTGDILKCEYFYKIAVVGDDLISQIKVVDVEGTPTIKDVKRDFALTGNNAISITNGNIDFGSDNNCYLNCQVSQMNLIPYVIEADIVTCGFETDTESNKMRGIFTFGKNKSTLWGLFFNTEATAEVGKGTLTFRPQLNQSADSGLIAPSEFEGKTLKLYCNCGLDSDNNIIYDKNNALIYLDDVLLINGDFSNYSGENWGEMCSMGWSSYNWGCPGLLISEYRVKELSKLLGGN